jgi:poly(hydroxyalkanoate) depolymerase family esterase
MNHDIAAAMRRATQAMRAFDLAQATGIIQDAVAQHAAPAGSLEEARSRRDLPHPLAPSRARPEEVADLLDRPSAAPFRAPGLRLPRPLGEVVRRLSEGRLTLRRAPLPGAVPPRAPALPIPEGAEFRAQNFTCAAGTRSYRLYVPASVSEGLRGVIVMLHGCTQTPEDFAAGTAMNAQAEAHRLLVAYPAQTAADNAMSCWNWFRPGDQKRAAGEPAIIAGLTESIVAEFGIPRDSVFIAGLSAGGAMAAVMGATYPDLYAAVGVHSGLAHGAADDAVSAFAAMRGETDVARRPARPPPAVSDATPRIIVFHGTADTTVHPANAERIVAAARCAAPTGASRSERGATDARRGYRRTVMARPDGTPGIECWMIEGGGHAWSGGHPSGSYADPDGPDASAEMVRFFLGASAGGCAP